MSDDLSAFIADALGHSPRDLTLFESALTHSSVGGKQSYERLEFLGDRVLGLVVAAWLYERFGSEPEGKLSHRYNALVARETCADVGRDLGVPAQVRLGKQAREDGASHSENVVGDVVEALIGALFLEAGLEAADAFIRRVWAPYLDSQRRAPRHPKSLLLEWAAANGRKSPVYEIVARSGPPHAPRFTIRASVRGVGEGEGTGSSKQEAETAAAEALLDKLQ